MNSNFEISPSYAMKLNSVNGSMSDDIWGDNIQDSNPSFSPFLSCTMGHAIIGVKSNNNTNTSSNDECYNFNFKTGAPISGKEYYSTPTLTHG